nr:hypothetical protein B0A51_10842 [Rachicladosporium sp. CCFEE 5018]OQO31738.1 hypothetical protein B0A51_00640 [Rachicladosporium sp. CCFEE 5018]
MPPSRAGRKRFFHEISKDTEEASLQPADVTMDDMTPISEVLPDAAPQAVEVAEMHYALSSEGTMIASSQRYSTSTSIATSNGLGGGGVGLPAHDDNSSSTLAHESTASPSPLDTSPSSPSCGLSPSALASSDHVSSDQHNNTEHDESSDSEAEVPPFCNYLNYCDYLPETTVPLSQFSGDDIKKVLSLFPNAHSSYVENFLAAYLSRTTFTVKVWINFDPSRPSRASHWSVPRNFQGYYTDRRAEDTGKLILAPTARRFIDSILSKILRFHHIRLDICTPFRHLANLNLDFEMNESLEEFDFSLSGKYHVDEDTVGGFKFLKSFVQANAKEVIVWVKEHKWPGLNLADLDEIATLFRRLKEDGDGERTGWMTEPMRHGGDWTEPDAEPEVQDGGWDGYVPFVAEDVAW